MRMILNLLALFTVMAFAGCDEVDDEKPAPLTGEFTDSRDGNTYQWITIGGVKWMAENLRYLPSVNPPSEGSNQGARSELLHYYVYGYDGTDLIAAKAYTQDVTADWNGDGTDTIETKNMYDTYGVLYDFNAAMDMGASGISSSSDISQPHQGACPSGWVIPSDEDWKALEIALGLTPAEADMEGDRGSIAKSLASQTGWSASAAEGDVGNTTSSNNSSGFSALPAGSRFNIGGGRFSLISSTTSWWSLTKAPVSINAVFIRVLAFNQNGVNRVTNTLVAPYSVRCRFEG